MNNNNGWRSGGEFIATLQLLWATMKGVANWHGVPISIINWLRTGHGEASLKSACLFIIELWKQDRVRSIVQDARSLGERVTLCEVGKYSLASMISQLALEGRDSDVSEVNFPCLQTSEPLRQFWNFHLDFYAKREEIVRIMASAGYRPATVIEFISWLLLRGALNSGIEYPIVALGQDWNGSVVKICKACGGGLCLAREYLSHPFDPDFRFLGVRLKEGDQPGDEPVDFQI